MICCDKLILCIVTDLLKMVWIKEIESIAKTSPKRGQYFNNIISTYLLQADLVCFSIYRTICCIYRIKYIVYTY